MKRVFAVIGFTMALTMFVANLVDAYYIFITVIGLTVIFAVSLFLPYFRNNRPFEICLATVIFACFLFLIYKSYVVSPQLSLAENEADCRFYVIEKLNSSYTSNSYLARIQSSSLEKVPENMKLIVYTTSDTRLEEYEAYSGHFSFFTQYEKPFESYGKYADGIFISATAGDVTSLDESVYTVFKSVGILKQSIINKLTYIIGNIQGVLSTALITGDTSLLPPSIKAEFTTAGVSHIMAVSGLHLSLITGVLVFALKKLKVNRKISSAFGIVAVFVYMAVVGFSGSVVRAGIMMSVLFIGDLFSRRSDSLNSLGIALFLMCLNPYAVSDVGMLFSICAVLSLVTLYPLLMKRLPRTYVDPLFKTKKERLRDRFLDLLCVFYASVCISVYCLPVTYMFYSSVCVISPLSNLLVLPLASVCVVLSFLTYFASVVKIDFITIGIAFLTKQADTLLLKEVNMLSSLGNTYFYFDYRYGAVIAGVLLIIACAFLIRRKTAFKIGALLSAALILVCSVSFCISDRDRAKIYVFGENAVFVCYKNINVVWGVDTADEYYSVRSAVNSNGGYIDYLVCDNLLLYSSLLSNDVSVNTLIYNEFNDTILVDASHQSLEIHDYYNIKLCDDFELYYDEGDITLNVKGFDLSSKYKTANAFVGNDKIIDDIGEISIKDEGVCYTIDNDNTYSVRRLNKWQK